METAEELRAAVKALRNKAGLSVRDMAQELGMSASGYSHYEQRIKEPHLPPKIAIAIAEVLKERGLNPAEALDLSISSRAMFENPFIDAAAGTGTFTPQGVIDTIAGSNNTQVGLISVFDIEAQAGVGMIPSTYEAVVDQLAFPPEYLQSITSTPMQNLAIIGVVGASMQPTLNHGDVVMVDMTKRDIDFDGMFVIRIGEALKVKRANWGPRRQSIVIRSDNANKIQFPDEEFFESDDVTVIGRVVWVGAKQP